MGRRGNLLYHSFVNLGRETLIKGIGNDPSSRTTAQKWNDIGNGDILLEPATTFSVVATGQELDLESNTVEDIQLRVSNETDWFAIGFMIKDESLNIDTRIYSEDYASVDPAPTLVVEYQIRRRKILVGGK